MIIKKYYAVINHHSTLFRENMTKYHSPYFVYCPPKYGTSINPTKFRYYDTENRLHNDNGPAIVNYNGSVGYYRHGEFFHGKLSY